MRPWQLLPFVLALLAPSSPAATEPCIYERIDGWMRVHRIDTGHGEEHFAVVTFSFVTDTADSAPRPGIFSGDTSEYVVCGSEGDITECISRMGLAEAGHRRFYYYHRTHGTRCSPAFTQLDTLGWMYPGCRECIGIPSGAEPADEEPPVETPRGRALR
ncbi:MAG: hypothetical protein GF418_12340 [Chitinivibrionales bacterium]|nr:hypothetical protein [Chitinivibrionales bacterium]MBD3396408.1 hypothetical protein [Chitinivibrionales bacterium]